MLIGKKIRLRRIEKIDLWQLWKWHEIRELYLFRRTKPFLSWDEVNQNFMNYFGWNGDFLIEGSQGEPLGVCSYNDISWKNRSCQLDLQFYRAEQASAKEAISSLLDFMFDELSLSRVYSFVPDLYLFEIQLLEKSGFILEGKLGQATFRNGQYHDLLAFAMLKEEFEKERP